MHNSILDNVVYLHIETTNNDSNSGKRIKLDLIKIKGFNNKYFTVYITENYNNLNKNIYTVSDANKLLNEFTEGLPIIIENLDFKNTIVVNFITTLNNQILNLTELVSILEPYRHSYDVITLLEEITTVDIFESETNSNKSQQIIYVLNSLLCRLWQKEEEKNKMDDLYKYLTKYFDGKDNWSWCEYLLRPVIFSFNDYPYVLYNEVKSKKRCGYINEIDYTEYEKLLRKEEIWNSSGDFNYQYREDQEKIACNIRENYRKGNRIFIEAPTGSGKTFSYLLIASIVTYLNKLNKNYDNSNFIISTDTKELQNQLIDKDIPNILSKLNLTNKVTYGAMKGKSNYICIERIIKIKDIDDDLNDKLTLIFLKRFCEEGYHGDLENINIWAMNHYNIEKFKNEVNCDSEECNLDRCRYECYLKNRYNSLAKENITVVNHSLLASWPYTEKRKVTHLIIDEAHNLMEKAYDFFSEEFNSYEFIEYLKQLDFTNPSIIFLLKRLNGLYNYKKHINGDEIKTKHKEVELCIVHMLNEFRRFGLSNVEYNFSDEFVNSDYKLSSAKDVIQDMLSELKRNIYNLYKLLNTYVEEIIDGDEKNTGSEYRRIMIFINKLKNAFDTIDNFIEISRDHAKIIEIDKEFRYFIIKNTPLNIGSLINENILNEVKSTVFISATLRINNSFTNIKKILGQNDADTLLISSTFNLKSRTKIFSVKDIGSYKNTKAFTENSAKLIFELSNKLSGHIMVLFSNNLRREMVYENLIKITKDTSIEVHTNKKSIRLLKEKDKQIIILGSKGFFEGIDLPGDYLNCVVIDKIPNVNPTNPLFKALKAYKGIQYSTYNYPRICIKMKQGYGRLVRSIYDYGYFIILDGGENDTTLRLLEKDLNGPTIEKKSTIEILSTMDNNYMYWQKDNLRKILNECSSLTQRQNINSEFIKRNVFWERKYNNESNSVVEFEHLNKKLFYKK